MWRLFGAFREKRGTSGKAECRGASGQGLFQVGSSIFMLIFFRLSDWSICTTWYKMLLSDWLGGILTMYTTHVADKQQFPVFL